MDLGTWTQEARDQGEQVVLLMDANQALEERTEKYCLNHLLDNCNLSSVMEARHPGASINSTKEGSETIDHILVANRTEITITKCGQLPSILAFAACPLKRGSEVSAKHQ